MREPFRVAVWGPGTMGQAAIREIIRLPETDLVAVYGYNPDNQGRDVGLILNLPPTGVSITTHFDDIVAAKPEILIHTPRDFGDFRADAEIIRLLEAGINVISVLPYQYPAARGAEVHEKFQAAGEKGDATLHGTGIDPGFLYERLAATMTGISNDIQTIRLEEYVNVASLSSGDILEVFGFGSTLAEMEQNEVAASVAENYLTMGMRYLADHLGEPILRISRRNHHEVMPVDTSLPNGFAVKSGTVGIVSYEWTGYVANDKPMFQIRVYWYLNESVRPAAALGDDYWVIEVEGIPSSRLGLEIKGSIAQNLAILSHNPAPAAYMATIIPAIQAIPLVVKAAPGVMVSAMPEVYWKRDLRQ